MQSLEYRRLAKATLRSAKQAEDDAKADELFALAEEYEARAKAREAAEILEGLEGHHTRH